MRYTKSYIYYVLVLIVRSSSLIMCWWCSVLLCLCMRCSCVYVFLCWLFIITCVMVGFGHVLCHFYPTCYRVLSFVG